MHSVIPEHIKINADLLEKAPRLALIQTGAGYDNVNLEDCTKYGIQVCNASGVNATAVAEHVMAFILCWYKNITYLDSFVKTRQDERALHYRGAELSEKTIGIIGMGHIGKKVAAYCNAFRMKVLGYSHTPFAIDGACLDVYEDEPLPIDNPLRDLPNVILTPHTAGLPDGVKYHKKRYDFFISNINKVMHGELPECRLNHV